MEGITVRLVLAGTAALIGGGLLIALGGASAGSAPPQAPSQILPTAAVSVHPEREASFGDLHPHTTNSFDAYALLGTPTLPSLARRVPR